MSKLYLIVYFVKDECDGLHKKYMGPFTSAGHADQYIVDHADEFGIDSFIIIMNKVGEFY